MNNAQEQQAMDLFMDTLGVNPANWVMEMRIQNTDLSGPNYYIPKSGSGSMMSMATRCEQEEGDTMDDGVLDMFRMSGYGSNVHYYEYDWSRDENYAYPNAPDVNVGERVVLRVINQTDAIEKIQNEGMDPAQARFLESNVYVYRPISVEEEVTEGVEENLAVWFSGGTLSIQDFTLIDGEDWDDADLVYHELKVTPVDYQIRQIEVEGDDGELFMHPQAVLPHRTVVVDARSDQPLEINLDGDGWFTRTMPQEWRGETLVVTRNFRTFQGDEYTQSRLVNLETGEVTEVERPLYMKRGRRRYMRISNFRDLGLLN